MKHSEEQQMLLNAAYDMLDFCGGDLSVSDSKRFWIVRGDIYNISDGDKEKVFLLAYSLIEMP